MSTLQTHGALGATVFRSPPTNKILTALSLEALERIRPHLTPVPLPVQHIVYKQAATIRDIYFPGGGAVSITKVMEDGGMAEIATVGNEGMLGSCVYFGEDQSIGEVVVQIADGGGCKMPVDAFLAEMRQHGAFHDRVLRYSQALTSQLMQTTVCNGLHSAQQRCCRWLLMSRDRVDSDDFRLTHELLAMMLGVRRPTVTIVIGELEREGLVENKRGTIRIKDRVRLEAASCECYAAVRANFARLLPEMPGPVE